MEEDYLYISALQHFAFCPRQFALIHLEQVWADNSYTAEGNVLHERIDSGVIEQRRNRRYERSVLITSHIHKLVGQMDLLEIETDSNGHVIKYFPVEYKRGKPKIEDWDRIQVCAQALCIEEMRNTQISAGAIWYWEVHRRELFLIDEALRTTTLKSIECAHSILASGKTQPPTQNKKRCKACSLVDLCEPDKFRKDKSIKYIENIFDENKEGYLI